MHSYRNRHQLLRLVHPLEGYSDEEYLPSIGAAVIAEEDGQLHPAALIKVKTENAASLIIGVILSSGETAPAINALRS